MTLTKKMIAGVLGSLLFIFIGTYLTTLNNSRTFFMNQMNSNAQDTATSLGLSLSHALHTKDKALILSMVQAVFDRGYFTSIEVKDAQGNVLVSRYERSRSTHIPKWFIQLIKWKVSIQTSLVMNGWFQVGQVEVISNPGVAYDSLWRNAIYWVYWYLLFASFALFVILLFIGWLMRPLKRMTIQANAICNQQFPVEENIPKTFEFKQLTLAMNKMVTHIKQLFEQQSKQVELLSQKSFQDQLTGLGNRRFFIQQLTGLLNNEEEFNPGVLLFIAIDGLNELNKNHGYQVGDEIIVLISTMCSDFCAKSMTGSAFRISGSNFAIIIQNENSSDISKHASALTKELSQAIKPQKACKIYVSVTPYKLFQECSELLTNADLLLIEARQSKDHLAYRELIKDIGPHLSEDQLLEALKVDNYDLCYQNVSDGKDDVLHRELFLRLNYKGEIIRAGRFMPIAEKFHIVQEVDYTVLSQMIKSHPYLQEAIALNISEATVINENFSRHYLNLFADLPQDYRSMIYLEFKEKTVFSHFDQVMAFTQSLEALNIKFGLDQVGSHFTKMDYLNHLSPYYLKLHGSLIQDVVDNQNKQFFLHYFNEMAKTLAIKVIPTQVETQEQWQTMKLLGFTWGQGRYLAQVIELD